MTTTVRPDSHISISDPPTNHQTRAGTNTSSVTSPKRLARIAGVLYLFLAIFGGFAQGFVEPKMYVVGDAVTTAGNVLANAGLVRLGVVSELLGQTFFMFLALTLYVLLKHVHQSVARAMLVLVALAAGITCLNTVFLFEALRVATGAVDLSALGVAGSNAVVLLLLDAQHYGILVAQIFFGLWLVPLGYLAYKSAMFPKALGVVLIVGGVCYLLDLLAAFLVPDLAGVQQLHAFVVVPTTAIAEFSMVIYLLVVGVKTQLEDKVSPQILIVDDDDSARPGGDAKGRGPLS